MFFKAISLRAFQQVLIPDVKDFKLRNFISLFLSFFYNYQIKKFYIFKI